MKGEKPLLEIRDLRVSFSTRKGKLCAVNGVSLSVNRGKTLCVVGESGSGKSVTAMSVLRLLDENASIDGGEIIFRDNGDETDLVRLSQKALTKVRGNRISVIFQEPMTALNPVLSIRRQLSEPFVLHRGYTKARAAENALKALRSVRIPQAERVLKSYPHQLSGGMRQRVMIAMALACQPGLLIADEPTTALDVTVQAQILRLMRELQQAEGTAILFITHDLAVVNEMADDVAVMYCGQIVERAPHKKIFGKNALSHPYTEGLMRSLPAAANRGERLPCIQGNVPHPMHLPNGCKFAPRCDYATERCVREEPNLFECAKGHRIRCFYPDKEQRQSDEHAKITLRQRSD